MKAVIIDDESMGRMVLREKIKSYIPEIDIIEEAEDGISGIELITRIKPDIVFLDIEMPGMNGFEMLDGLSNRNFNLVFTTAYDQFAIKAFRYAAIDYLLKPIDITELKNVIARILKNDALHRQSPDEVNFELLKNQYWYLNHGSSRIAIPNISGIEYLELDEILYMEADNNYTIIFLREGSKIVASRTLKDYEDILTERGFYRIHHSFLVHLKFIKRYLKGEGGQVEIAGGKTLDVSRRRKEGLLTTLKQI